MEFFREKNGKFYADSLSGNKAGKNAFRFIILFMAAGGFAAYIFLSPDKQDLPDKTPLIIGFSIFLFTNLIAMGLRKAGHGSGIIVDQMNSTISYRKPGGNRHSVPFSALKNIIISIVPEKASVLCLANYDGTRHVVMYSSDTMQMRQLADELSSLVSITVDEEIRDYQQNNA